MTDSEVIYLLLRGAIRKDYGNGHRFYHALEGASKEQLERALAKLEERKRGVSRHSYYPFCHGYARVSAIKEQLKKLEQELAS